MKQKQGGASTARAMFVNWRVFLSEKRTGTDTPAEILSSRDAEHLNAASNSAPGTGGFTISAESLLCLSGPIFIKSNDTQRQDSRQSLI